MPIKTLWSPVAAPIAGGVIAATLASFVIFSGWASVTTVAVLAAASLGVVGITLGLTLRPLLQPSYPYRAVPAWRSSSE